MARRPGKKEPVRDKRKIRQMKEWLLQNKTYRDFFLLHLGFNTGLRISDLLALRVMDVRGKEELRVITQKTGREIVIPLNGDLQQDIRKFTADRFSADFLFRSREGENKAISAQMADRVLKQAANAVGVDNWGTHSMRKSFGYHYYMKTQDVYFLMRLFGHSSQSQTLDYIGVTQDEIRKSLDGFSL